jgi:predicted enzyme related to lactoylglutathione lyase
MPQVTSHPPGSFCWAELATSNWQSAKRFYTQLFGWTTNEIPMQEGEPPYVILQKNGLDVAALYQRDDVPPNWMSYVATASADETAKKAKGLGATVVADPFDVFDSGRMAVLQDPLGAFLAAWQPKNHIGARLVGEPDSFCWNELYTTDVDRARKFYTALFGWKTKDSPGYTEWMNAGQPIGGMMKINPEWGDFPPNWTVYFMVTDCDAVAEKAKSLGSKRQVGPQDIPNVGRFAMIEDPQGAMFAIIKLT